MKIQTNSSSLKGNSRLRKTSEDLKKKNPRAMGGQSMSNKSAYMEIRMEEICSGRKRNGKEKERK